MVKNNFLQAIAEELSRARQGLTPKDVLYWFLVLWGFVVAKTVHLLVLLSLRQRRISIPAVLLEGLGRLFEIFDEPRRNTLSHCTTTLGPGPRDTRCSYCYDTMQCDAATIEHSSCRNRWHSGCIDHRLTHVDLQETACPLCRDYMDYSAMTAYVYRQGYRPRRLQLLSDRLVRSCFLLALFNALFAMILIALDTEATTARLVGLEVLNSVVLVYAQMTVFVLINNWRVQEAARAPERFKGEVRDQVLSCFFFGSQQMLAWILLKNLLYGSNRSWFDSPLGWWVALESLTWAWEAMETAGAIVS